MKIYNTLTRKIEEFKPIKTPKVGMYTCGLTVYDYMHIGHARTYVFADILRRTLEFLGYQVINVRNITDVGHLVADADEGEDKVAKAAQEQNKTPKEIADFYEQDAWEVEKKLNILRPTKVVHASEHIKEMIELVKKLEEKGYLYKREDGLYFDISKLADYGKLGGFDWKEQQAGARVPVRKQKRNLQDFAVWKFAHKHHLQQWDSPWGKSFPGWHIECSAMSMKYLGEQFDIHTGGVDHIQVHHNNEIAQSEAATGKKPFVKYWLHAGHLLVDGKKMSKSLKNFYRLADLEVKGFDPLSLRYFFLTANYRQTLNFSWQALKAAQQALIKLKSQIAKLKTKSLKLSSKAKSYQSRFKKALESDLNIPQALAVVWEVVKSRLSDEEKLGLVVEADKILGLDLEQELPEPKVAKEIGELVVRREELRKRQEFAKADELRRKIEARGYRLEDTDKGASLRKK